MGTQNIGAKYQSISFDKPFIQEIKDHIKDKKQYRSLADFARDAIRNQIRREQRKTK
jgi:Arc/MetJ-type ribon-helix-helix transcriptional regulator